MSGNGPSLDDLVRAHRNGIRMTEEQRATNRARLMSRLLPASLAAASTASIAASATAGSAGATSWIAKAVLGVVLAGGASAAYIHAGHPPGGNVAPQQRLTARPPTAGPLTAPAVADSPSTESPDPAPASPSSVTHGVGTRRLKRLSAPAAPPASASLAVEVKLMHDVDAALKSGYPESALALLDERREGDGGYMQEERAAARVFAVCQMGRIDSARAAASRFLRERPHSPLAARVRASCAALEESSAPRKPQ
jgi:hypothetical protein